MTRRTASDAILLAVFVLLFATAIAFVVANTTATPLHDDALHAVAADPGFEIEASWLWAQHNEHRIPLPRFVYSALLHVTRDYRTAAVVNVFLLAGASAGLALLVRRLRGRSSLADAFFPCAFFSWGQYETLLSGFQIVFVLPVVIACALAALFAGAPAPFGAPRILAVGALTFLLPLCGAPGVVQALPIVVWLAAECIARPGEVGRAASLARMSAAVSAVLITALSAAYFRGLRTGHENESSDLGAALVTASQAFGTWTGDLGRIAWPWSGVLFVSLAAAAAFAGVRLARRERAQRARWTGLLAVVIGSALTALAIGHGRGGDGANAGFASRYGTLMLAWPSAIFLGAALLPHVRWTRAVQYGLGLVAACGWVASLGAGNAAAEARAMSVLAIERRAAQGVSYTEMAERRAESTAEERGRSVRALRQLDRAGIAPFAHPRGRDPWLLLGRDPWTGELREPKRVLTGPPPVEMRLFERIDAFVVEPGSTIGWDLPDRVSIVRGLCGAAPGTAGPRALAMFAEIRGADGSVLASSRIEIGPDSSRAADGSFDFGLFAAPAGGRTLELRCEPNHGADVGTLRAYWAEVRMR